MAQSGEKPRWDLACKVADKEVKDIGSAIRSVACTEELVVTSSLQSVVKVWQVAEAGLTEARRIALAAPHAGTGTSCVEISEAGEGHLLAVSNDDGGICIWDLRDSSKVTELDASIQTAWKVKFLPGSQRLASGGPSGAVCFWDLRAGGRLEGEFCASGMKELKDDDLNRQAKKRRKHGRDDSDGLQHFRGVQDETAGPIFSLAVSPDGSLLGCGRSSGTISIMRLDGLEWARHLRAHTGERNAPVRGLAFDSQSRILASGGDDHHVCICSMRKLSRQQEKVKGRQPMERIAAHRGWVSSVSFCPDPARRAIVTTSWDHTVKLWDYKTHALLQTYTEHSESVYTSAFAPKGGRFFVSAGQDALLVLYTAKHEGVGAEEGAMVAVKKDEKA